MRPLFTGEPIRQADAVHLAGTLKALADPTRLRLLSALHARGRMYGVEADACYHLAVLAAAGVVVREPEPGARRPGGRVYHRVSPEGLAALADPIRALAQPANRRKGDGRA